MDEKIKHKNVLDVWTTKTQVRSFLMEKAKSFKSVKYASDYSKNY